MKYQDQGRRGADLKQLYSRSRKKLSGGRWALSLSRTHWFALGALAATLIVGLAAWRAVSANSPLTVNTVVGSSAASGVDWQSARGIALQGTLIYVADTGNQVVRQVNTATTPPTVTIVAGTLGQAAANPADLNGDGGPATAGLLNNPSDVAVDGAGNLYIADTGNHRIRKVEAIGGQITPASLISTVAGNGQTGGQDGPALGPALSSPRGLWADAGGNLYIADTGNHRIRRIIGSTIQTIAGNGTQGSDGDGAPALNGFLNAPLDVAVDASGNVYLADTGNHRVRVVNTSGVINAFAGNGTAGSNGDANGTPTSVMLHTPSGVAVDGAGRVYIADTGNHRIRMVSSGTLSTLVGNSLQGYDGEGPIATARSLNLPIGVAANSGGSEIFFMDSGNRRLRKISGLGPIGLSTIVGDGSDGYSGDSGLATAAKLRVPQGVALDAAGNIYIADTSNHVIRKVTVSNGQITTIAGTGTASVSATDTNGDTGPATSATLNQPTAVVVDASGNVYIADTGNHRVRKIDLAGNITTVAGLVVINGTPTTIGAALNGPRGLADDGGAIYIADTGNHVIRLLGLGGTVTTVAGSGLPGSQGDNGAATSARLNQPSGVAVNDEGVLYIADTGNHRIRKVDGGVITTIVSQGLVRVGFEGDGGSATLARLNSPSALALDAAGNLYITDKGNNRIRKVTASDGKINTIIGNGTVGFSGDGGFATSAAFNFLSSVAAGAAGVYVADTGNNRIRLAVAPPNTAPVLTSPGNQAVNEGAALNFTLSASDTAGQTLTYSMTGAPPGATLDSATGAFSYSPAFSVVAHAPGPPPSPAQFTVTFKATDDGAPPLEDTKTITITVNDVNRAPTASAGTIPAALEATGPAGATLALNGSGADADGDPLTFAWTNTVNNVTTTIATVATQNVTLGIGSHSLVLTVSDDKGGVTSTTAAAVVVQDTQAPVIANVPANITQTITSGTGENVSYTMPTATDAVDGAVTVNANIASGSFFPIGTTTVTFTATDARGNTATASFSVTIDLASTGGGGGGMTSYGIDALAGTGAYGSGGNAGAAIAATFKQPHGVAVDGAGNIFIADAEARVVRKVNAADGQINVYAGTGAKGASGDGGPATAAQLNHPSGLAVDSAGNLYIADTHNHRIRRVAANGTISTVAGSGVAGFGGDGGSATSARLSYPMAVAVDGAGNVFVGDTGNNRIRKVTGSTISTVAGNGASGYDSDGVSATAASLDHPTGVAVTADGNTLYIADTGNNRVRKVTGGTISTLAGTGAASFGGDGGDAAAAGLNAPTGVLLDGNGDLLIADSGNERLRKVQMSDGQISTIAGTGAAGNTGDGGPALSATLDTPAALARNSASGVIVLSDAGNLRVRKLTPVVTGPVNNSPVPDPVFNQSLNDNQVLNVALSAADADGDPVTFSVVPSLPFLSIVNANPAARTAVLRIDPNGSNAGVYNVQIQAADDQNGTGLTAVFTITVNNTGGGGPANNPPVAQANALATPIEATGPGGAQVNLNGSASSDPDGDPLTYQWSDNGTVFATSAITSRTLSLGTHVIALTVNDGRGGSHTTSQTVLVRDTTAPAISVTPSTVTFEQGDPVVLPTPVVSDTVDTSVTVTNNAPANYPPGTTVVTFTATDDAGNSATATVTVVINGASPVLTAINPTQGTQGQTLTMTLSGSNFAPNAQVSFSGGDITVQVIAATPTQITATVIIGPNAIAGSTVLNKRSVTVTNPGSGSSTLVKVFSVLKR
jgi:sugar lactone lactonase YvrE